MPSLDLTLYYSNSCSHCNEIKKQWPRLVKNIKDMGNKYNSVKISAKSYESEETEKKGGGAKINGEDIEGYPTIKFALTACDESKEYEYLKERDVDKIVDYVKKVCNGLADYDKSKQ